MIDISEKLKDESFVRIWKIREKIQELENLKNDSIKILKNIKSLDKSTRKIYISDIKECYYSIVAAWVMLEVSIDDLSNLNSSKLFLDAAISNFSRFISELKTLNNSKITRLINKLNKSFDKCIKAFKNEYENLAPSSTKFPSYIPKVIKVSDSEYRLPCSVCGNIAVIFRIGVSRFEKRPSLIFEGITHTTSLSKDLAPELFKILDHQDLKKAHQFMKKYHSYEGLDAYCPQCDKIYCRNHYNALEEWDEGFYDYTEGTCPEGHTRIIDD
ncbi:MAG: hypothetical protein ACTSRH_03190 [Promethearchaeota archaeon]